MATVETTTVQVTLPQMGESVSEGTVLEWHKAEGDQVAADETLVEVSTDKVDAEVRAPAAGTVVKIHAQEGETVEEGKQLGTMEAMKMESSIRSPAAGTVEKLAVQSGTRVEPGDLLIVLKTG